MSIRCLVAKGACLAQVREPLEKVQVRSLGFLMESFSKLSDRGLNIAKPLGGRCYTTEESSPIVMSNLLNRPSQKDGFESIETVKKDLQQVVCREKSLLLQGEVVAVDYMQPLNPVEFSKLTENLRSKGFEVILPKPLGDKNSRGVFFFCVKLYGWEKGPLAVAKNVNLSDIWKTG